MFCIKWNDAACIVPGEKSSIRHAKFRVDRSKFFQGSRGPIAMSHNLRKAHAGTGRKKSYSELTRLHTKFINIGILFSRYPMGTNKAMESPHHNANLSDLLLERKI